MNEARPLVPTIAGLPSKHTISQEGLLSVATDGLGPDAAAWIQSGGTGATFCPNECGGFLFVGYPENPDFGDNVPSQIQRLAQLAWSRSITWLRFDPDGYSLPELRAALGE